MLLLGTGMMPLSYTNRDDLRTKGIKYSKWICDTEKHKKRSDKDNSEDSAIRPEKTHRPLPVTCDTIYRVAVGDRHDPEGENEYTYKNIHTERKGITIENSIRREAFSQKIKI